MLPTHGLQKGLGRVFCLCLPIFSFFSFSFCNMEREMKTTTYGQSTPRTQQLLWPIDPQKLAEKFSQSLVVFFFLFVYFISCVLFSCLCYTLLIILLSPFFISCPPPVQCFLQNSDHMFFPWDFARNLTSTSPCLTGRAQSQPHLVPHDSFRARQLPLIVRTDKSFQLLDVLLQPW